MKKITFIKQFFYNVVATALPTLILQLLILPLIAKKMDGDVYGLILTIVATASMVAAGVGNVLNNVHMLSNNEYEKNKVSGDFGILFVIGALSVCAVTLGISRYYQVGDVYENLLICAMAFFMFSKEYYIVRFWMDLDYLGILKCNLLCVMGYVLGLFFFWVGGAWQGVYIIGNSISLLYILKHYGIPRPFFEKTVFFWQSTRRFLALTISTILSRALQYVDRLLLYPLLGGEEVTIYYVSTLIGKTITMALNPINSFFLSQLAKRDTVKKNLFGLMLLISFSMGVVGYVGCMIVARPLLGILYPQWIEQSIVYIRVTTITAILSAIALVVKPMVLKFCNMSWTIVINGACFVVYIGASLFLLKRSGLMGFCIGGLLANAVSLALMIVIYLFTGQKGEND